MIGFAETNNRAIVSGHYDQTSLQKHVSIIFASERFINSVRQSTSDQQSVKTRIDMFSDHLNKFNAV